MEEFIFSPLFAADFHFIHANLNLRGNEGEISLFIFFFLKEIGTTHFVETW